MDADGHVLHARAADAHEVERARPAGAAARPLDRGLRGPGVAGGADDEPLERVEAVVARGGGAGGVLHQQADGDGGVARGVVVAREGEARHAHRAGGGGGGRGVELRERGGDALADVPGDVRGDGEARAGDEGRGGGEGVGLALVGLRGEVVEAELGEGVGGVGLDPPAMHEGEIDVAVEYVGQHAGIVALVEDNL